MSDVIVSTEGGVFHEEFCPYILRIQRKNKRQMPEEKALHKGYCECKFCRSIRGLVYKYRHESDLNVSYDPIDQAFCIRTKVGFWKLIWRENKQVWHLFHMNHRGWKCFDEKLPSKELMRGSFHRQEDFRECGKISKAIKYILSHDKNYQLAEEDIRKISRNTPAERKHYRQQKNRKKRESVKNVYRIFDELERKDKNGSSR